jgi:formylglycine-generating enzyme required for sulfatase activity
MRSVIIVGLVAATACVSAADNPLDARGIPVETVLITGATFKMGTPITKVRDPEYHPDEAPIEVTVREFRIGKYPVTAEQMCLFLNSDAGKKHDPTSLYNHRNIGYAYSTITRTSDNEYVPRKGAAKAPANQVTWKGAALFCKWLSDSTGKKYRLPTEAEWELAARGPGLRQWPWGVDPPTEKHGERYDPEWHRRMNSGGLEEAVTKDLPTWTTIPVGSHAANRTPEGVHDMLGYLIGEWCANPFIAAMTGEQATRTDADLTDLTSDRAVRGYYHRPVSRRTNPLPGPWPYHTGRAWTRKPAHPMTAVKNEARYGFRVVEEVESLYFPTTCTCSDRWRGPSNSQK